MIIIKVKGGDISHDLPESLWVDFHMPGLDFAFARPGFKFSWLTDFLGNDVRWLFCLHGFYWIFCFCALLGKVQYLKVWEVQTHHML